MNIQLINVGSNCLVSVSELIAILRFDSAPMKKLLHRAKAEARLIDATAGKPARSVVLSFKSGDLSVTKSNFHFPAKSYKAIDSPRPCFILSSILPETVAQRLRPNLTLFHLSSSSLEPMSIPMDIKLISIGLGNIIAAQRVIAIIGPDSAPIKRVINDARDRGQLIDATYGRRTRAVIITDSGHIVLTSIQPETVANRFAIAKEA
jgi:regulator of extracellular matrix RemA (YlzA/DUF370 family)